MGPLKFRQELGVSIFKKYATRIKLTGQRGRTEIHHIHLCLRGRHFPKYVTRKKQNINENEDTNGKSKRHPQRAVCKKLKETLFECKECGEGLCAAPCFEIYHTQQGVLYQKIFDTITKQNFLTYHNHPPTHLRPQVNLCFCLYPLLYQGGAHN